MVDGEVRAAGSLQTLLVEDFIRSRRWEGLGLDVPARHEIRVNKGRLHAQVGAGLPSDYDGPKAKVAD